MADKEKKTVLLFTACFPYSGQENFIEDELIEAVNYCEVLILNRQEEKSFISKNLPDKVRVVSIFKNDKLPHQFLYNSFRKIGLIASIIIAEASFKNAIYILKNLRKLVRAILRACYIANKIEKFVSEEEIINPVYYSYWMNDWALALAILKHRGKIDSFVIRLHGFDIYDERREGNYMPFRTFIFSKAKKIFTNSERSLDYLRAKNIYPEKIELSYLGVKDYYKTSPVGNNNCHTLVSCSRVVPLKRVSLIVEILKYSKKKINWVHFGDGPGLEALKELSESLPSNVSASFKGHVAHNELMNFYADNKVDIFLHVSETEGFGVAHVEALSFGIPVFSTDVGGVREFIDKNNGFIFPVDFKPKAVAEKIDGFLGRQFSDKDRQIIKKRWADKFESSKVYGNFYQKILK